MKNFLITACCICILLSCSKKIVPSKPNYTLGNNNNSGDVFSDSVTSNTVNADSIAVSTNTIMVIADGFGRLITPKQNLPQNESIKYNSLQLSKGFTTQQRANLQARYHIVPPRVLYVPQQLSLSSLKGNYYILKNKFWYWKKPDGLYYLDQKYYL